ncbi:unnamed protein product [Gongylonema pulchrum]|uniref:Transmembrane protein n=1 Tax=Gongylonema pulchrum TaxID=637853 RepID=A0A183DXZ4_9BILA|nr:unnamed protein product [Gongylonema pulchrum]
MAPINSIRSGVTSLKYSKVEPMKLEARCNDSRRFSLSWGSFKARKSIGGNNLALFEEPSVPFVSSYLKGYTTPGPLEREESKHAKAELGVMLGVYLPTIQHILGVTMFIRLFWLVGIAGIAQTFFLLLICCLCVSYV